MKCFSPINRFAGLVLLALLPFCLKAQENAPNTPDSPTRWQYGAGAMGGFLMPHHGDIAYLQRGHVKAFEVEIAKTPDGSKDWHHYFNFPTWGFSFDGYDLASEYVGKGASARIFFDLPFVEQRSFGLKLGIGGSYVEKPFDKDANIHNSAVGSTLNTALAFELYGRIKLTESVALKPGLALHHFSNGAIKLPNSGLNYALLKLLMVYAPNDFSTPGRLNPEWAGSKAEWRVGSSFGAKEVQPIGGGKYFVYSLFGIWQKRISPKSSFGADLGYTYNASLENRITDDNSSSGNNADNYRAYIAALYQLHFDPFGIRFEAGSYIAPRFKDDGMIFLRYHLLYNLNRYQVFFGLKSHFAKADHFELGLNYKLNK